MPRSLPILASASLAAALSSSSLAGSHLWEFWEVFSNADGTIQFIELHVNVNANQETFVGGKKITSLATGKSFTFPSNLQGSTGFKYLLLGTAGFAALPGAPAVDFVIPNGLIGVNGDTLKYHIYDTLVFTAGQLPLDCVQSMNQFHVAAVNTPKNYAGATGTVNACPPCPGDLDGNGVVDGADIGAMLAAWGSADLDADLNTDNVVDGADLGMLLGSWGGCP